MLQKKNLIIIGLIFLIIIVGAVYYFSKKSSREITGVSNETGKVFNFTEASACAIDDECAIVHKGIICPYCDRPACQPVDFLSSDYVAVNFQIFSEWRESNCSSLQDCLDKYGPLPDCPIKLETNERVAAKCIKNTCQKVIINRQ